MYDSRAAVVASGCYYCVNVARPLQFYRPDVGANQNIMVEISEWLQMTRIDKTNNWHSYNIFVLLTVWSVKMRLVLRYGGKCQKQCHLPPYHRTIGIFTGETVNIRQMLLERKLFGLSIQVICDHSDVSTIMFRLAPTSGLKNCNGRATLTQ